MRFRHPLRMTTLAAALLSAGCAAGVDQRISSADGSQDGARIDVLSPARIIADDWERLIIEGDVDVIIEPMAPGLSVRLSPKAGAGGVFRRVNVDARQCPLLSWSWWVPRQRTAVDLEDKKGDDVDAAVFVVFGDPGPAFAPKPVHTIRYVATSGAYDIGEVIPNPYAPAMVVNVVAANASMPAAGLQRTTRNLVEDYRRAFGRGKIPNIGRVAIFADSDQTGDDIDSYFYDIHFQC